MLRRPMIVSTHAPLAGRDFHFPRHGAPQNLFQPTRPLRGATSQVFLLLTSFLFQPTRPLRGATAYARGTYRGAGISTHAPLAGRDFYHTGVGGATLRFQPTRPLRGATNGCASDRPAEKISTHAPLAGRDGYHDRHSAGYLDFNPRAPCGARRRPSSRFRGGRYFNPRAPCGARLLITCPRI